jgi:hypothetical protein
VSFSLVEDFNSQHDMQEDSIILQGMNYIDKIPLPIKIFLKSALVRIVNLTLLHCKAAIIKINCSPKDI